jgi:hypothetical protein
LQFCVQVHCHRSLGVASGRPPDPPIQFPSTGNLLPYAIPSVQYQVSIGSSWGWVSAVQVPSRITVSLSYSISGNGYVTYPMYVPVLYLLTSLLSLQVTYRHSNSKVSVRRIVPYVGTLVLFDDFVCFVYYLSVSISPFLSVRFFLSARLAC